MKTTIDYISIKMYILYIYIYNRFDRVHLYRIINQVEIVGGLFKSIVALAPEKNLPDQSGILIS